MNKTTTVHPDVVRDALLSTSLHPSKRRNIELIHEVCRDRQNSGSRDFGLDVIAPIVANQGGPKGKTLWNRQSADYCKLIEAWQAYIGEPELGIIAKSSSVNQLTRNIADPAIRIVVGKLISERDSLRSEVNILKAQSKLIIDKRPVTASREKNIVKEGAPSIEIVAGPQLNSMEREALIHAISPGFLSSEGWQEDKAGRLIRDLGDGRTRPIFKPGFVSALRKILEAK